MYYKTCNKCFEEKEEGSIKRDICNDCKEKEESDKDLSKFEVSKDDWRHLEAFDFFDVLDFDWE